MKWKCIVAIDVENLANKGMTCSIIIVTFSEWNLYANVPAIMGQI